MMYKILLFLILNGWWIRALEKSGFPPAWQLAPDCIINSDFTSQCILGLNCGGV